MKPYILFFHVNAKENVCVSSSPKKKPTAKYNLHTENENGNTHWGLWEFTIAGCRASWMYFQVSTTER